MEISFGLYGGDPDHWVPLARHLESLGFAAVWFGDHLISPMEHQSLYPHSDTGKVANTPATPLMDPAVAIAWVSQATSTIMLGTGVYVLPLRDPFVTARAYATAQLCSGGRLLFGVGSGWLAEEYHAVGQSFKDRGRRMDEILDILQLLWSGQPGVDYRGDFYAFQRVQFSPKPEPPIPVIFGGESRAALRRAARRGDGWFGADRPLEHTVRIRDHIEQMRTAAGRDHLPFQYWPRCHGDPSLEALRRYEEAGFDKVNVAPWRGRAPGTLREKLDSLEAFADGVLSRL